jgi:hypothetical protein
MASTGGDELPPVLKVYFAFVSGAAFFVAFFLMVFVFGAFVVFSAAKAGAAPKLPRASYFCSEDLLKSRYRTNTCT